MLKHKDIIKTLRSKQLMVDIDGYIKYDPTVIYATFSLLLFKSLIQYILDAVDDRVNEKNKNLYTFAVHQTSLYGKFVEYILQLNNVPYHVIYHNHLSNMAYMCQGDYITLNPQPNDFLDMEVPLIPLSEEELNELQKHTGFTDLVQCQNKILRMADKINAYQIVTNHHQGEKITHIDDNIIHTLNNNVNNNVNCCKIPNSFVYSSFPNRGLLNLLNMFPKIRSLLPDATLNVFCDMDNTYCWDVAKEDMIEIVRLLEEQKEYVTNHGFVSKKILYHYLQKSTLWLYPCTFEETFCITALEAQMAGCLCISNDLGALPNINKGIIIPGDASTLTWQEEAIHKIILNKNNVQLIEKCKTFASQFDWSILAQNMVDNYINKNINKNINSKNIVGKELEYCGMYNWSNDVPQGSKDIFLKILDNFVDRECHLLEIGTYTGTSIIHMLEYLPLAKATVIDLWEDYEESSLSTNMKHIKEVFYNNLLISGLKKRVNILEGDSKDVLMDLIRQGKQYDFIYVDGSHQCLDCYSDMVMGWELLGTAGIMGIDDYMWKPEQSNTILDYPQHAIDHFMKRYYNIKVINVGYRVFLQKI